MSNTIDTPTLTQNQGNGLTTGFNSSHTFSTVGAVGVAGLNKETDAATEKRFQQENAAKPTDCASAVSALVDSTPLAQRLYAIIDKNCRIGDDARINGGPHLENSDHALYTIKDGIVVLKKGAVIPNGFVI